MKIKRTFTQFIECKSVVLFLLGLIIVAFSGWMGDIVYAFYRLCLHDELSDDADANALFLAIGIIALASIATLYLSVNTIKVRHLKQDTGSNKRNKCQAIILCCSPIDNRPVQNKQGIVLAEQHRTKILPSTTNQTFSYWENGKEIFQFSSSINQAISQLSEKTNYPVNWQQQLRAIAQKDSLEKIYLIGSHEMAAKWQDNTTDLSRFRAFLQSFFHNDDHNRTQVEVIAEHETANKDNMNDYYRIIEKCIHRAEKHAIDNEFIIVDVTGGQVPASIGGSLATLHNEVGIQYVNNDAEVTSYNVNIEERKNLN